MVYKKNIFHIGGCITPEDYPQYDIPKEKIILELPLSVRLHSMEVNILEETDVAQGRKFRISEEEFNRLVELVQFPGPGDLLESISADTSVENLKKWVKILWNWQPSEFKQKSVQVILDDIEHCARAADNGSFTQEIYQSLKVLTEALYDPA